MDNVMDPNLDPNKKLTAEDLVSLEGLILGYLSKIERHKETYGKHKEMLDNILENSADYKEAFKKAKEAAGEKNQIRSQLLQAPEASSINEKVKEIKSDLKHLQDTLSIYLQQYALNAATNQIEDDQGVVHEIVYAAKIVKRSNKFRT
jgi:CHASE3 domain sensor protein